MTESIQKSREEIMIIIYNTHKQWSHLYMDLHVITGIHECMIIINMSIFILCKADGQCLFVLSDIWYNLY